MELDTLQFVVRADGRPTAVQIDIKTWHKIVEALEDAEDVSLAREALTELEDVGGHYRARAMLSNSEASVEDTFGRPVPSN